MGQAHAAGLVHRDLKPANLFVADPRRDDVAFTVKVLDFGIAKVMEGRGGDTSEPIGSPLWMAPEQCGPHRASPATDVWALGLVAYFCLVGRSFWKADPAHGMTGLLTEILTEPIPSASTRAQEQGMVLGPEFDDWFARTVVRDPAARFRDASQALAALGPWSIDVTPPSRATTADVPGQVTWSGTSPPLAPDTRATQPPTAPALDTAPVPSESTSQTFGPVLSESSAQSTPSSAGRWVGLFAGVIVAGGGALVLVALVALYLFAGVSPISLLQPAPGDPALDRTQSPTHVAPSLPEVPLVAPFSSSTPSSTAQVVPTTRTAPTSKALPTAQSSGAAPSIAPAPTTPTAPTEPSAKPTPAQVGGFRAIAQNCWANNEGLTADAQVVSITVGIDGGGAVRTIRIDGAAPFPQFRSCVVGRGRSYSGFKQPPAGWSSTTFSVSLPRAS